MMIWDPYDDGLGLLRGHVPAQAAELGAQEGLGAAGAGGGLAEGAPDVGVAGAGGALPLCVCRRIPGRGGPAWPRRPGGRGRKAVMSVPTSAMRSWAAVAPKPGMPSSWAICRS